MNFNLPEELERIRDTVAHIVAAEIKPKIQGTKPQVNSLTQLSKRWVLPDYSALCFRLSWAPSRSGFYRPQTVEMRPGRYYHRRRNRVPAHRLLRHAPFKITPTVCELYRVCRILFSFL
jgi:hypothetical protein